MLKRTLALIYIEDKCLHTLQIFKPGGLMQGLMGHLVEFSSDSVYDFDFSGRLATASLTLK